MRKRDRRLAITSQQNLALIAASLPARADPAPEIAGQEIVGTGVRFHLTRAFDVFTTFSYDNNQAKLFRAGFNVTF